MNHRYSHILSPIRVGNLILKNRIINSKSIPEGFQCQDPDPYPNEQTITFAANLAKNGASIVTCSPGMFNVFKGRTFFTSPFDMDDRNIQPAYKRMIERIHSYGTAANAATMCNVPTDVSISELRDMSIVPKHYTPGPESPFDMQGNVAPEITKDQIKEFIAQFTDCCCRLKDLGFDMINIYASYNASLLAKSLSPLFNQRVDEYGGSLKNRARLLIEIMTSVKKACGSDFPIELQLSGKESFAGGYTMEDFVEYCKLFDGLADIIQTRAWTGDYTHASSYNCKKDYPTNLVFAEALKKAGIKALVAPVGGFQDLDLMDKFIADGRTDLIAMARALICDDEYGKKLYEGRGEDVIACIRCDKCHSGVCSVNPKVGTGTSFAERYSEPTVSKKVAVIGGGPAGLKAAATAAQRGHSVTLFEKENYLGGQLHHADFMYDKWSLKDFKDSLVRQVNSLGVDVKLGVDITPEMIGAGGFDAVIAACGSVPKVGSIPGADGKNVWVPFNVFGHEQQLGKNVVVIGGAMVAVDTALYLAHSGHKTTLITRNREAAYDNNSHSNFQFREALYAEENITIVENAQVTLIEDGSVTYDVKLGAGPAMPPGAPGEPPMHNGPKPEIKIETHTTKCDNIVFSAGRRPLVDDCLKFASIAPQFFVVGDANMLSGETKSGHPGERSVPTPDTTDHGVRHSIMTAYAAANMI